jgi:hypothetical protein
MFAWIYPKDKQELAQHDVCTNCRHERLEVIRRDALQHQVWVSWVLCVDQMQFIQVTAMVVDPG